MRTRRRGFAAAFFFSNSMSARPTWARGPLATRTSLVISLNCMSDFQCVLAAGKNRGKLSTLFHEPLIALDHFVFAFRTQTQQAKLYILFQQRPRPINREPRSRHEQALLVGVVIGNKFNAVL